MSSLVFPQLSSGASAQFPIRKSSSVHTVTNLLEDGTVLAYADANSGRRAWDLLFSDLSSLEVESFQNLFDACVGMWAPFTFIDPSDNMFGFSADLSAAAWQRPAGMLVETGASDPFGGLAAFRLTNAGQVPLDFVQTFETPASYKYCCSLYVKATSAASIILLRDSEIETVQDQVQISSEWTRVASSSQLTKEAVRFAAGIRLLPGQQLTLYGLQMEPQLAPSRYRATVAQGGVYANAHWASDQISFTATSPGSFSTSIGIEVYR